MNRVSGTVGVPRVRHGIRFPSLKVKLLLEFQLDFPSSIGFWEEELWPVLRSFCPEIPALENPHFFLNLQKTSLMALPSYRFSVLSCQTPVSQLSVVQF